MPHVEKFVEFYQRNYSEEAAKTNMRDKATWDEIIKRVGDPNYINFFRALAKTIGNDVELQEDFWKIISSSETVHRLYEGIWGINEFFMHILAASSNIQTPRAKEIELDISNKIISNPIKYAAAIRRTGYINKDIINALFNLIKSDSSTEAKVKALEILESVRQHIPLYKLEGFPHSFEELFEILLQTYQHGYDLDIAARVEPRQQGLENYIESYRLTLLGRLISDADERSLQIYISLLESLEREEPISIEKRFKLLSIKFKNVKKIESSTVVIKEMIEIAKSTNQIWKPELDDVNSDNIAIYLETLILIFQTESNIKYNVLSEAIDHIAEKLQDPDLTYAINSLASLFSLFGEGKVKGAQFNSMSPNIVLKLIGNFVSKLKDLHTVKSSIEALFPLLVGIQKPISKPKDLHTVKSSIKALLPLLIGLQQPIQRPIDILSFITVILNKVTRESDPILAGQIINILLSFALSSRVHTAEKIISNIAELLDAHIAELLDPQIAAQFIVKLISGEQQFIEWHVEWNKNKNIKINIIANIVKKLPFRGLSLDYLINALQEENCKKSAAQAIQDVVKKAPELDAMDIINRLIPFLGDCGIGHSIAYIISLLLGELPDWNSTMEIIDNLLSLFENMEPSRANAADAISRFVRDVEDPRFIEVVLSKLSLLQTGPHARRATDAIEQILSNVCNPCLMPIVLKRLISTSKEERNIYRFISNLQTDRDYELFTIELISLLPQVRNNEENVHKLIFAIERPAEKVRTPDVIDNAIKQLIIVLKEQKREDILTDTTRVIWKFALNYKGQSLVADTADTMEVLIQFIEKKGKIGVNAIRAICILLTHSLDTSFAEKVTEQLIRLPQEREYSIEIIKALRQLSILQNPIVTARAVGKLGIHLNTYSLEPTLDSYLAHTALTISELIKELYSIGFIEQATKFMMPIFQITGLPQEKVRLIIEYSELLDVEIITDKLITCPLPHAQWEGTMRAYKDVAKIMAHLVNEFMNPNDDFGKRIIEELLNSAKDRIVKLKQYNAPGKEICEGICGFLEKLQNPALVDYAMEGLIRAIEDDGGDDVVFRDIAISAIGNLAHMIQTPELATYAIEALIPLLCEEKTSASNMLYSEEDMLDSKEDDVLNAIWKLSDIVPINDLNGIIMQLVGLYTNEHYKDNEYRVFSAYIAFTLRFQGPDFVNYMARLTTERLILFVKTTISNENKGSPIMEQRYVRCAMKDIAVLIVKAQNHALMDEVLDQLASLPEKYLPFYLALIKRLAKKPEYGDALTERLILIAAKMKYNTVAEMHLKSLPINKKLLAEYPLYHDLMLNNAKWELSHNQTTINETLEYFSYFHEDFGIRELVSTILRRSPALPTIASSTLHLLSSYEEFDDILYPLAAPYIKAKQGPLIGLNAAEDDRNLADHGHLRQYWYSINDGFKLLIAIRNKLNYRSGAIIAGEEYSAIRENSDKVFLSDPYYIENFSDSLKDDIKTITGTHVADQQPKNKWKWSEMPRLLVIPILAGMHWRVIRVEILYDPEWVSILYSDPYGEGGFHNELIAEIENSLVPAIKSLFKSPNRTLCGIEIARYKKILDQQGKGRNNFDCAPVTFSNIKVYIDANKSNKDLHNTTHGVSPASAANHEREIVALRAQDVDTYMEVSGAALSGSAEERIQIIQELLKQSAEYELPRISKALDASTNERINSLTDSQLSALLTIIHENRTQRGDALTAEYSIEELSYAYKLVIGMDLIEHVAKPDSEEEIKEEREEHKTTVNSLHSIEYANHLLNVDEGRRLLNYAGQQYGVSAVNVLLELGKYEASANMILQEVKEQGYHHVLGLLTGSGNLVNHTEIGITITKPIIDPKVLEQAAAATDPYGPLPYTLAEAIRAGVIVFPHISNDYGSLDAPNIREEDGGVVERFLEALPLLVALSADLASGDPIQI